MATTAPTATAQSSSTTATPPEPKRLQVRETAREVLTAYQVQKDDVVQLQSGHGVRVFPGEWVIYRGLAVVDTITDGRFKQSYEVVGEPQFTVTAGDRATLEKELGFGSTKDSQSLTLAVKRLAALTIGDIKVNFTVSQWEEIARRAEKRRLPVSQYVDQLVQKLTQDIWVSAF